MMAPLGLSLSPELVVLRGGDDGCDEGLDLSLLILSTLSSSMPMLPGLEMTLLRLLALLPILLSLALSLSP